jgi:C-terminal processing protease CtpA/Prc
MKKALLTSAIIHLLLIALLAIKISNPDKKEKQQKSNATSVEIIPKTEKVVKKPDNKKDSVGKILVKSNSKDVGKESKSGYYGIGIYSAMRFINDPNGNSTILLCVSEAMPGYPAEEAGLIAGDCIIKVDGELNTNGSRIIGEGEKDLEIEVLRNGRVFTLKIRRRWIKTG